MDALAVHLCWLIKVKIVGHYDAFILEMLVCITAINMLDVGYLIIDMATGNGIDIIA